MSWRFKYIYSFVFPIVFQIQVFGNEGESLFVENCAICHTIGQGDLIGPDLKNIHKNRAYDYFQLFIKNSQEFIKSGDSIALSVYKNYDESIMPEHSLSDPEITEIWQFIQTFEGEATFVYSFPVAKEQTSRRWLVYLLALIVLGVVAIIKRKWLVVHVERITKKIPFQRVFAKRWKSILILIFILFVLFELNSIGVFTGYQPNQPILFSHKVHCSQNKISCKYCHYDAYKEEYGGLPPLSTCMNCHKYVNKGALTDTVEISKLYDWVGYDSKSKEYIKEQKQMGWINVYNLPDHARFNHHIHTDAHVSCTECHGLVEEMEEIRQVSSLTMKWCVECHNRMQVPLVGYFSENTSETKNYKALSAEERANYALRKDTIFKAYKNMGGLDCYKCHN